MNDILIIKLYRNDELQSDYHDLIIEEFNNKIKELYSIAQKYNKALFFSMPISLDLITNISQNFAEIEYTGNLAFEEKEKYVEILKTLSTNAEFNYPYLNDFQTLKFIKFRKIDKSTEDLLFISD